MARYLDRPFHGSLRCLIGSLDWFLQGCPVPVSRESFYCICIIPRYFYVCCILQAPSTVDVSCVETTNWEGARI